MNEEISILEEIKFHCRIDNDLDENINKKIDYEIESLKLAAETYLKNAGIKTQYENNLYFLAIKMLVWHWYDNKEIVSSKTNEIPFGITVIINQLQIASLGDRNEAK